MRIAVLGIVLASGCLARGWIYDRLAPGPPAPTQVVEGLDDVSAQTCGGCHTSIYGEWSQSMMSKAFDDPLFQAQWKSQQELFLCLHCHTPLQEQQPVLVTGLEKLKPMTGRGETNQNFDAELQHEGVTCAACHVKGGKVVGSVEGIDAPHPVAVDSQMGVTGEVCEGCHQLDAPVLYRLDRPLSDTFGEWRRWKSETGADESCVDCHMSVVERPWVDGGIVRTSHDHRFLGRSSADLLRSGLRWEPPTLQSSTVEVVVENLAGHNYPTGEPGHRLVVSVALLDDAGLVLQQREERMVRNIQDRVERSDSTLKPGEVRRLLFSFDLAHVERAKHIRTTFGFEPVQMPAALLEMAGLSDAERFVLVEEIQNAL